MKYIFKQLSEKDLRSKMLNKNIFISLISQGVSIVASLLLLPLSLDFVSIEQYGVWLSISSVLIWTSFFGLGIGSGLKNSLGNALAINDLIKAKQLISTAYLLMGTLLGILALIYFIASNFIDWVEIFKISNNYKSQVQRTVNVVIYLFLLRLVLELIYVIFDALQKLYISKILGALSQVVILLNVLFFSHFIKGSIFNLALIFSVTPILMAIIGSIWLFKRHPFLKPSLDCIQISLSKKIFGIGMRFFVIQICQILLFQSTNIIIIRNFGPAEVVKYNVVYNLFSMMSLGFATFSAPYWSAYVNAWAQRDIQWILKSNKRLMKIWMLIAFVALIVLVFSDKIYYLWLGRNLNISIEFSVAIYLYMCVFSFSGIYNMFINAVGKLKLQIYSMVISTLLYYPLLLILIKFCGLDIIAIPLSLLVISNYTLFIAPWQFKKIITNKATGIWDK